MNTEVLLDEWYGTRKELFDLEEWLDIDAFDDVDDDGNVFHVAEHDIYKKQYEIIVSAMGTMNADYVFYDWSNFNFEIVSDDGFTQVLSSVPQAYMRKSIRKAYNNFLERFKLGSSEMNNWEWNVS